ncbi:MAG: hypothetical protein WCI87_08660 [Euryarchaeota archaeon]
MNIERLRPLFEAALSEMETEMKSYVSLFCAECGYCINDSTLFFDDAALLSGVRVALKPALRYGVQELADLAVALEDELNNIVFDHAYNTQHKIGAEDSKTIEYIPYVSEHMRRFMIVPQN